MPVDKKTAEIIGAIFVAIIFLTSYAAFGSNSPGQSTTTTAVNPGQTFYAEGNATGTVVGYGPVLSATISCNSSITGNESSELNSVLADLEGNSSVSNYYSTTQKQFFIESGNLNSSGLYYYLYGKLSSKQRNCTSFSSSVILQLASIANFTVQGQHLEVPLTGTMRQYSMQLNLTQNMAMSYPLRVAALLTENGTIYGNLTILSIR